MKLRGFCTICSSLLFLSGTLSVCQAATNILYVPNDALTNFGSSWSDVLFFRGHGQQIYSSNAFSEAKSDVIWITEVAFRAEETYEEIGAWFERLAIHFNLWRGPMEELVARRSGLIAPIIFVYNGTNVQIDAQSGILDAFDAQFPITPPFRYDRREGQLVLYIERGQNHLISSGAGFDLSSAGESYRLGAHFYPDNFQGAIQVARAVFSTRFTYFYRVAEIRSVKQLGSDLRLEFHVAGPEGNAQIEAAEKITGPFSPIAAEITRSGNAYLATLPIPSTNQFFRILLN